ncbi:MAG: hypothetical protein RMI34_11585 [Chloroherpetonaceae bacterium]|nr:hypothetical protein [Chloroherpetonaceae bacterium]
MKEVQVYTRIKAYWSDAAFYIEVKYLPSVYTAKAWIVPSEKLHADERESLEQAVIDVFEERLKADFKRQLEDTEEKHGFLETSSLSKLSERLLRYLTRALALYPNTKISVAID